MPETVSKVINQSSVEVAKNTRGYTYTIKSYGDNPAAIKEDLGKLRTIAEELISEAIKKDEEAKEE